MPPILPTLRNVTRLSRERGVVRLVRFFVIFVCVVMLAANGWVLLITRDQELEQARMGNENLARAVAQQMDALFGETGHVLASLVFELDRRDLERDTLQDLQPQLVHEVAQLDHLDGLFVIDAQGRWRAHSQAQLPSDASSSDREYFREHRDSDSERIRIGAPVRGRIGQRWLVPVSRRLNDPYGRFAGVVMATVSVDRLAQMLAAYEVGDRGAILLGRRDGQVLTRWPLREQDLGASLASSSVFQRLSAAQRGTYEAASPLDGEHRLVSFQHARNLPLYVTVALSHEEIMRDWRTSAFLQTAWTLVLCLIVGATGSYVVRAVRRRSVAEHALLQTRDALELANLQLSQLASHDALTGLANRRALDARLQQAVATEPPPDEPAPALMMIDVDHFKRFNDLHGHQAGDECLIRVAAAVRAVAEAEGGLAARFGGEEMAVLLPAHPQPARVAEAVRAEVAALVLPGVGPAAPVTVSIGLATLHASRPTVTAWLGAADRALYAAKAAGRNRVVADEAGPLHDQPLPD
ncbi:diguanylate cyclase [Xenophilus arseniciresistens]|uniref:diguanylate cyclase n=1 Tax=Xenophilus arseniciresistens TaxID=1283306 RepID=A0AAE3N5B9_9BURK|nr:diguanylate cyclase [Xenophilus arseniciresistens]MDA7414849.1 diguanylate cyclase [Xenophilus arseniciresistens]